jgi:dTDP-4-dehydrorhamnose reductase
VCRELGAQFVTFSTDYVFDGTKDGGYVESDRPRPINAYGRSKLLGERLAVEANPDALIVRTSWLLSGTHPNFAQSMLSHLPEGTVSVVNDQFGHPTLVDDLVPTVLEALTSGVVGTLHLANSGTASWYELACEIAAIADIDPERVKPCATEDYPSPASRPRISILDSERLDILGLKPMPSYRGSLVRAVDALVKP